MTAVTALALEQRAVRRLAPHIEVVRAGVGLQALSHPLTAPVLLSIGLAGGLRRDLAPGTVVIPHRVDGPAGDTWATDATWSAALRAAARRLGLPTAGGALVATDAMLVTAESRRGWAVRGYDAADMESAAIAARASRLAVVRVILDTPAREISPLWWRPLRAAIDPRLWPQAAWLMRNAPRFAGRAAAVLAEALRGHALERDVDAEV